MINFYIMLLLLLLLHVNYIKKLLFNNALVMHDFVHINITHFGHKLEKTSDLGLQL